jgi:hypothetical protein
MTTPQLGPADVTMNATVTVPVVGDDLFVRDDTAAPRIFLADRVTITYAQSYTDAGSKEETVSAWTVTARVDGSVITGGRVGRRPAHRTFRETDETNEPAFPSWLAGVIDRYHPGKTAADASA